MRRLAELAALSVRAQNRLIGFSSRDYLQDVIGHREGPARKTEAWKKTWPEHGFANCLPPFKG